MTASPEQGTRLRALSRALQDVHRSLMETVRAEYEAATGPVRGRRELLDLLLHGESFAWLRTLSELIVEIDELASRAPAPTSREVAEMAALVEGLIRSSDDPDAFGSRYVELLASEPHVAMSHVSLREVLRGSSSRKRR